jgi:peptide/nickel transport system substrate-binding protein
MDEGPEHGRIRRRIAAAAIIVGAAIVGACNGADGSKPVSSPPAVLRVGVAQLSANNPLLGLRQLSPLLSVESLARPSEDGRMQPWLAETWTPSRDGRSLIVRLRPSVKFHDGSAFDTTTVANVLSGSLRSFMGPVFADIDHVKASGANTIEIAFTAASPLLVEALEASIQKPGTPAVGTGPFMVPQDTTELRANRDYYQGRPAIERITVANYPNVRAAWAEMLRDNLDMLWEVGADALNSLERSSTISTFTYTRHYQYIVALNTQAPALRSREIRRALNLAVDRADLVKRALNGFGVVSSGPLPARHWALRADAPQFMYDPRRASAMIAANGKDKFSRLTCLVTPDSLDERIALELKRQLAAVGVDLTIEEASRDEIVQRASKGQYEAAITEVISGPSLFRVYSMWHRGGATNWGNFGNASIDAALDRARHAASEDAYRNAVAGVQQAFMEDPPGVFLAWSVRARAVSRRFDVPAAEPGRDILSNVRLWKPVMADGSRN